jgi:hypothetical protein
MIFCFGWSTGSGQFYEGFEGDVFPPEGWISFHNGIGTAYNWQASEDAYTGSGSAFVRWENVDEGLAEDWLVTPMFTPTDNAHRLSFYQKDSYARDYFSVYTVRVSLGSQDNPADFEVIDQQYEYDMTTQFTRHQVDLSAYIGQQVYLAFVMENDDGDNWIIDDVVVSNCEPVAGLFTGNATANGADLYWEDNGAGSWSIEIVPFGEIPTGVPDFAGITGIPFVWTGGDAFTRYAFYVQSDCGVAGKSHYSAPGEFTTACAGASCEYFFVLADTYGDDWNGAYIEIRQGGIRVGEITQEEAGFGPFYYPFSFCDDYPFELIWHAGNWDQECIFGFYDAYDQLYYHFEPGDFPDDGAVFYRGNADCDPVTCRFPYNLEISALTAEGATISWTDRDPVGQWDIEIVPYGTQPTGLPTIADVQTRPYTWTGGEPGEYYDVYVRSVCGQDDRSKWSLPASFATLCDKVYSEFPFDESFISVFDLPECWSKQSNGAGDQRWHTAPDTYSEDSLVLCRHDNDPQDEWLMAPVFDFSGLTEQAILRFDWKTSYYWMVNPYNNGDLNLRISVDRGQNWSNVLWNENQQGEFTSFEWQRSEVDLSDYIGEPEVWIAFQYVAEDAATVYLDNFQLADDSGSITGLNGQVLSSDWVVYPNPVKERLYLGNIPINEIIKCRIVDINGRIVQNHEGPRTEFDLSGIPPGIYFIRLEMEKRVAILKFMKLED